MEKATRPQNLYEVLASVDEDILKRLLDPEAKWDDLSPEMAKLKHLVNAQNADVSQSPRFRATKTSIRDDTEQEYGAQEVHREQRTTEGRGADSPGVEMNVDVNKVAGPGQTSSWKGLEVLLEADLVNDVA